MLTQKNNLIKQLLLKVSYEETSLRKRKFFIKDNAAKDHLESIGRKFLDGYHLALRENNEDHISRKLSDESKIFNGFCFEGAAMAKTILDGLSLFNKTRLDRFLRHSGDKHLYMIFVGIGWGYARLPFSVEKKLKAFDSLFKWLILDGYGFHQAYFKTEKYVHQRVLPKELKNPFSIHVFYQGVGRSLWFIEGTEPERIARRIRTFPEAYMPDLWAGVGLAATYAGGAGEQDITKLKSLAQAYLPHLMQGAVFAAKARHKAGNIVLHSEMACRIITGLSIDQAVVLADHCLEQVPADTPTEQQYDHYRKLIRTSLYKNIPHEIFQQATSS